MSVRLARLAARPADAHKGHFGRIVVVGGSAGMIGAPALAANAALRGGAGLVQIAAPARVQPFIAILAPCATSVPLACDEEGNLSAEARDRLLEVVGQCDIVAAGPGLGRGEAIATLIMALLEEGDRPMVIDADGLNALARVPRWWERARVQAVLTPHPGEMKRLLTSAGLEAGLVEQRREAAERFASQTGQIVVLKGAGTVVTDGATTYINTTGNPGMATGGSGDVLTGLIAALMGQSLRPLEAAMLGVYLHGRAGDLGAAEKGQVSLTAWDLLEYLPEAIQQHQRSA